MRIEFTRYEQIWQTRQVIWRDADWKAFKSQYQKKAESATFYRDYYAQIYNIVKDMSFDAAIREYNTWREGDENNCIIITDGPYEIPLGALIHEALSDAAQEAEAHEQSTCDTDEYVDVYED